MERARVDTAQFGLHSLRAGGASAAANAGVPDRLFKRHGRWRSKAAKDGYIKDSEEALVMNWYLPTPPLITLVLIEVISLQRAQQAAPHLSESMGGMCMIL